MGSGKRRKSRMQHGMKAVEGKSSTPSLYPPPHHPQTPPAEKAVERIMEKVLIEGIDSAQRFKRDYTQEWPEEPNLYSEAPCPRKRNPIIEEAQQ